MASKGGLTSLPNAIHRNLTVGSLGNVTSTHLWFCFSWNMKAAFVSTQFNDNTSQRNISSLRFDSINLKLSCLWFTMHHACNKLDSTFHLSNRQTEITGSAAMWICLPILTVYTVCSMCIKIPFSSVYSADGDIAASRTLLLHYLLTPSVSFWLFNTMYSMCWFSYFIYIKCIKLIQKGATSVNCMLWEGC
jgi:hypothetical protein